MKKVSMLLLLTVVLAFSAFAIEGVGDFEGGVEFGFDNVTGENGGALGVSIEPSVTFSRDFGAVGLSVTLGDVVHIPTDKNTTQLTDKIGDELYVGVTPSLTLAAGPGELGLSLGIQGRFWLADVAGYNGSTNNYLVLDFPNENKTTFILRIDPVISYGLDAGFGTLSFELGTDHLAFAGNQGDDMKSFGLLRLPLYFQAGVDLPFGLGLWVHPVLGIKTSDDLPLIAAQDDTGLDEIDIDIHFAITEQILAGVEVDIPTVENGIRDDGITIIPRCELSFGALSAFVKVELSNVATGDAEETILGTTTTTPAAKIQIAPTIGVTYSF
jgi:hypothetical protein